MWHRRPGTADDDDDNWSVWFGSDQTGLWVGPTGAYEVDWLPEGSEPDWDA